jgi:hypothetical protein
VGDFYFGSEDRVFGFKVIRLVGQAAGFRKITHLGTMAVTTNQPSKRKLPPLLLMLRMCGGKHHPTNTRSTTMFKAIGRFFTALFTMFSALEKGAASLNHIAGIAEAEAEGLADVMAIEREEKIITIRKQPAVTISEDQKLSI